MMTKRPFNSWDALKLLGLLLMFVDHAGWFFYPDQLWLRAIGRGGAVIFLFLAGYASSMRFRWDIFVLAVLMTISDTLLAGHLRPQNILVTILLIRLLFDWLEKHGKKIEKPVEWYIGCLAAAASIIFVQYGSFGLLLALAAYMLRRPADYPPRQAQRFFRLAMVTFAVSQELLFGFTLIDAALMLLVLYGLWHLLAHLEIKDVRGPAWLTCPGKLLSYYSGYIYALHLIALEWITHKPF